MSTLRLIARLDIKGPNLIKGIHLEGLRVIGNPHEFALSYYRQGIDELVYIDSVASLYGRNSLLDIIEATSKDIFVPLTVGGGIRSVDDARTVLRAGADKVAINTAAIGRPGLITEAANIFGAQCIVISIAAKRQPDGSWEAFAETGRERTGLDVLAWSKQAVSLGAGEILLTSVDREGTLKGYDIDLVTQVSRNVSVPVIASGGAGSLGHLSQVIAEGGADAVAVASLLHYQKFSITEMKDHLSASGISIRPVHPMTDTHGV